MRRGRAITLGRPRIVMLEEEPLDRFRQRALALACRMRFDPFLVNEAIATLTCSLGTEWVANEANTQQRGTPWPFRDHPVGQMIHVAGERSVAEALELAHYLKTAASSQAFPTLVAGIKARDNAQYRHTLLQLAFHDRFALLADDPPILEPPTDGGRVADIQFRRLDRLYLVECYARREGTRAADETDWLMEKTLNAINDLEGVFSIAIQLHSMPNAAERKELRGQIVAAAKRLDAMCRSGARAPSELIESDAARTSVWKRRPSRLGRRSPLYVHPSFPDLGDPDRLIVGEEVSERAIRGLNPTTMRGTLVGHVAVWLPAGQVGVPETVDEQVLQLVGKMRTKLAQTRSRDAHRVLIVDTWTAHSQFRLSEEAEAKVKRAIFGGHSNVAGVLLVTRHFDEHVKRHRYEMKPLANVVLGGSAIVDLVALESELTVPEILS